MKVSLAVMVLVALLTAPPGQAANPAPAAGKSFLDYASTNSAEEPPYSIPASFPGPLVAQPRREPEPSAMLLACLGLLFYLGRRRQNALAASSP